jgi:hypothetical protein
VPDPQIARKLTDPAGIDRLDALHAAVKSVRRGGTPTAASRSSCSPSWLVVGSPQRLFLPRLAAFNLVQTPAAGRTGRLAGAHSPVVAVSTWVASDNASDKGEPKWERSS